MNKSAREMFEELGYGILTDEDSELCFKIKYFISESTYIIFYKKFKTYEKFTQSDSPFDNAIVETISLKEHKAINKQIEELKW